MKKNLISSLALLGVAFPLSTHLLAHEQNHNHDSNQTNKIMRVNPSNDSSTDSHSHGTMAISEGQPVPDIDLVVYKDPVKGWNLEIKLDNFTLTPENVNQDNQPNEGHAHLYVNGEQVSRVYSNWYHLPSLPAGENEIKVSLNSNSHEFLMYQGNMIEDIEVIEVQ